MIFTDTFVFFTVGNFHFFTPTVFCFHGRDLAENFTGTFKFSRADFKTFHGKVHIFSGGIIKFSREEINFSREKKTLVNIA